MGRAFFPPFFLDATKEFLFQGHVLFLWLQPPIFFFPQNRLAGFVFCCYFSLYRILFFPSFKHVSLFLPPFFNPNGATPGGALLVG